MVSNERVVAEWKIGNDLEVSGRSLMLRDYPGIRLEKVGKPRNYSVRITGFRADI
jgi:hypothetical protein